MVSKDYKEPLVTASIVIVDYICVQPDVCYKEQLMYGRLAIKTK